MEEYKIFVSLDELKDGKLQVEAGVSITQIYYDACMMGYWVEGKRACQLELKV